MFQKCIFLFLLFFCTGLAAQKIETPYKNKKIAFTNDTIRIENVSINSAFFKVLDKNEVLIDSSFYLIDFKTAKLLFKKNSPLTDSISIRYLKFPEFLTKTFSIYDDARVVPNTEGDLYVIKRDNVKTFKPFDGLTTSGSITRGVSIGNNQNSTLNSNLDLQITGKLSNKVSLRASIQDSNIPLQAGGYSQKLDEFDQIFIELFSDKWSVRAGDLFLENRTSQYLNFNKKVQGVAAKVAFGSDKAKTEIFASGALVRGQYSKSTFVGQEGNQGPYKLRGKNGELFVLIISGSESVFVNGILLKRGENNDYVIDYNAGELKFNSIFPITSEMRIVIEYQYSDRSYTRFVTYGGAKFETKKWGISGNLYSESDLENQPLQQNLSTDQVTILQNAGNDISLMTAPSASLDAYSANKILYKKVVVSGTEIYQYSTLETDVLYNVRFNLVGVNLGNYKLVSSNTIGKIYEYVPPISGLKQGSYEPIVRLIPPNKIQIATVLGNFYPSEKTKINFEIGLSNNDLNLFSSLDDQNNKGIASKINAKQRLFSGTFNLDGFTNFQFIQSNFKTVERLFTVEFNRDWNLNNLTGNQSLLVSGLQFNFKKFGSANYQIEKLNFTDNFSGTRHLLTGVFKQKNIYLQNSSSYLKSASTRAASEFLRSQTRTKINFKKNWIGASYQIERNHEKDNVLNQFTAATQSFSEIGTFIGRGDSSKVFVEFGYLRRSNDSLVQTLLKRVNVSDSYYIKSKLIQTKKSNLSLFINYRNLHFTDKNKPAEPSLNSRLLYNDAYFKQLFQVTTAYENISGSIAQQEFTYLEVNVGQGTYVWNDYNNNQIQELQEFELAPYPDQAKYVRVFLPNQLFIKTHQNKFSQSISFNPAQWQNGSKFKKIVSHFYNQSAFTIDRKILRNSDNFSLNPFANSSADLLGLNASFRNNLFFNRGKQYHSTTYIFTTNKTKNLLSVGSVQNNTISNQLQYSHLIKKTWLLNCDATASNFYSNSEGFAARNYDLNVLSIQSKIAYLFSQNTSLGIFYHYQKKQNQIANFEQLNQKRIGLTFNLVSNSKFTLNGEYAMYDNQFKGDATSPVAFQMLEGLQPGGNSTWRLLLQKNLTQYLDININYQGRKSDQLQTVHVGNVQLRAFF